MKYLSQATSDASSKLNKIDKFGQGIHMNFDGINPTITTSCGGFLTILFFTSSIWYSMR